MTRHRLYPIAPPPEHPNPEFVAPRKKRKPSTTDNRLFEYAIQNATEFCIKIQNHEDVDYEELSPATVVGLYCLFHRSIYDADADELRVRNEMMGAVSAIKRLIAKEFGGEIDQVFEYVRWTWSREKQQFAKRDGDFRITWRYQFCSPKLLTDYRVWLSKSAKVAR